MDVCERVGGLVGGQERGRRTWTLASMPSALSRATCVCGCECVVCVRARVCVGERKGVKEKGVEWGGSDILDRVSI